MTFVEDGNFSYNTFLWLLWLTDEYFEAKDTLFKKDMDEYERKLALYGEGSLKTAPKRPTQDFASLIRHFKKLSQDYRYNEWAGSILYATGYALYEQGDRDEAAKVFEKILKDHPESDHAIEVSFRLGELYFETGQLGEAGEMYQRILSRPASVFYDKALYKLGWVYFKTDDFSRAIEMFSAIADRKWDGKFEANDQMDEAISCIVLSLSHFQNAESAISYLQSRGVREYTPLILLGFGEKLVEQTRYNEAIYNYRYFTEHFPENPLALNAYDEAADLYERGGDEKEAVQTRWYLVQKYNPSTDWYRKTYPKGSGRAADIISKALSYASQKYYQRGKESGDFNDFEKAVEGCLMFLSLFPDSPSSKDMNLLLAEAFFEAKMYKEAAAEYEKVAMLFTEDSLKANLVYYALLSYELIFRQAADDEKEKVAMSAEKLLGAYTPLVLSDGKLIEAIYTTAGMYSRINAYEKGRAVLAPLLKGGDIVAPYKAIAELYIKENNLSEAEEIYSGLSGKSKDDAIRERLAQVRFMQAERYLKEGRHRDAVYKFNQSFATLPGSKVGEAALIKLGHACLKQKDLDALDEAVAQMLKAYPQSDIVLSFLIEAGKGLEQEKPLAAARLYENASVAAQSAGDSKTLIFAAGTIYEDNGDYKNAAAVYTKYLANKPLRVEDEADAAYRLGRVQLSAGNKDEGISALNKLTKMKGRIDDLLFAKASLLVMKENQLAYLDLKLTQPFEETFQKKTESLNNLLKDYSEIAKYKMPEILPDLFFQMGFILENFRDSMIKSERPQELTKDELDEYNFILEEKAYPYDEQAVRAYEKCIDVSRKNEIYDEWAAKCYGRLADLRPALYKRNLDDSWMEPVFISPGPLLPENK